jgi:hypothetical protein
MAFNIILKRVGGAELDGGGREVYKDWHFWVQFSPKMSSSVENMSVADIEKLLELRKEQDRKAAEEKKRKEKEERDRKDKERRDRERVETEEELAKAAKELEEEMEEEQGRADDADATPRARRSLFGESEEDEDSDEEEEPVPDETSDDPKEKAWVVAHKENKSAEIHLATARGNLTTALYKHGFAPSEEADKMLEQRRKELRKAVGRLRTARVQDALLHTSVVARRRIAAEEAAAEQQGKADEREKLASAARKKGAGGAPAPVEAWGGPGAECDACRDAKATCTWSLGNPKRIQSCDRCRSRKAGCKIGGAPDPRSRVLKTKVVNPGEAASEDRPAKRRRADAEAEAGGSGVGSSGATTGVGSGGVATGVGGGGNAVGAGATKEPSANTTIGQLTRLVAAQSEHMARMEVQMGRMVEGLERQMGQLADQVERIGNQVGRVAGVMERAEGWSVSRGPGRALGEERSRSGSERRRASQLSGPTIYIP